MIIMITIFHVFFQASFGDFAPYLITVDESLDALNEELPFPITMTRFRPNIVVSGLKAFQEVHLRTIRGLFEFLCVCVCVCVCVCNAFGEGEMDFGLGYTRVVRELTLM